MVMNVLMVTGGTVSLKLLRECCESGRYDFICGVDKGLESLEKLDIKPDLVVGDFDSADKSIRMKYEGNPDAIFLNPMKDFTDTHVALEKVLEKNPANVTILGATGTRMDHMLGNISILLLGLNKGVNVCLLDENNKITLIDKQYAIKRDGQYGKYVSLMPYTDSVNGIYLRGFLYNLDGATFKKGETIGISNEIREEEGFISIESGKLLVMETKD